MIYCKAEDDEFGNLDYVYICDHCLLRTDEEHQRYHTTEEGLKYIKSVNKTLIKGKYELKIKDLEERIAKCKKMIELSTN